MIWTNRLLAVIAISGFLNACGGEDSGNSQLIAMQSHSANSSSVVCQDTNEDTQKNETVAQAHQTESQAVFKIQNEEHYRLACLEPIQKLLNIARASLDEEQILPNTIEQNHQLFCAQAQQYAQRKRPVLSEPTTRIEDTSHPHEQISQTSPRSDFNSLETSGYTPEDVSQILRSCPARFGKMTTAQIFDLGDQSCGTATNTGVQCGKRSSRSRIR